MNNIYKKINRNKIFLSKKYLKLISRNKIKI